MRMTHVIAEGLVQGVCFRDYTRRQAFTLGLTGWVRNLRNGSVEAMLCGPTDKVAEMVRWLRQGPPHSRVDELLINEVAVEEQFTTFEIRY
ncbi:MAG: acylphosphatase [Proteobacteria bacterium]|nr:acylphosphatase [Pseudomonadota bacterium]